VNDKVRFIVFSGGKLTLNGIHARSVNCTLGVGNPASVTEVTFNPAVSFCRKNPEHKYM
jgi:hypothetical protein